MIKTKKLTWLVISILFLTIIPSIVAYYDYKETPTTSSITNDYPLAIASFIKEKCNSCKDTIILGDDYVVPYYRSNIPMDEVIGDRVDSVYTDTAYAQRTAKPFSEFDDLFYFDKNLDGKPVRFLLPSSMSPEFVAAVAYLNRTLYTMNGSSLRPKVEFVDGNTVNCNDVALFSRFSQKTIFVIGTEQNNRAFNCFPFSADALYRDTATIERNPWDTKQFAVVMNTESPSVLYSISKTLENGTYKQLQAHSIFWLRIGSEIAWNTALIAGTTAIVIGSGGTGAIALTAEASLWTGTAIDLEKNCNKRDAQGSCTQAWIQVGIPVAFKYLGKPALTILTKYPTAWLIKLLNKFGTAELYSTLKFYAKDIQLFDTIIGNFDRALRLGVDKLENYYRFVASKEGKYIYTQYTFPKRGVFFDKTSDLKVHGTDWGGGKGRFFVADRNYLHDNKGIDLIDKLSNAKTKSEQLKILKEIEEKVGFPLTSGDEISYVEIPNINKDMWRRTGNNGWRPILEDSNNPLFMPGGASIGNAPEAVLKPMDVSGYRKDIQWK